MSDLGVLVPLLAPTGFSTIQTAASNAAFFRERSVAPSSAASPNTQDSTARRTVPVDPLTGLARTSLSPGLVSVLQEIQDRAEQQGTAGSQADPDAEGQAGSEIGGENGEDGTSAAANGGSETGPTNLTPEQQQVVQELTRTDAEVRRHEQAHAAAGGPYAGAPSYDYTRGPDGRLYAIGGDVQIDAAPIPGNPEATIQKLQIVRRAALAPASPSPQDQRVAAIAQQRITEARREQAQLELEERQQAADEKEEAQLQDQGAAPASPTNGSGLNNGIRETTDTASQSNTATGPAAIAGTIFNIIA